jgi:menaquinol-cytochrome c reductase iron-sulfur subunit
MAKSPHLSRNDFVKATIGVLGTIMGVIVGIPIIGYIIAPALKRQESEAWIPAGTLDHYPVNEPTLFNFTRTTVNGWERTVNSYGVYIVRKSETGNDVVAFSNVCTHLACRVNWNDQAQEYICPCHDGKFNIDGTVVAGPPPRPLDRYETKVEDGNLSLHFQEGKA